MFTLSNGSLDRLNFSAQRICTCWDRPIRRETALFVFLTPGIRQSANGVGRALLQKPNKDFGKAIVMVTHDPHSAAAASRLLHLDKGKFIESTMVTAEV